MQFISTMNSFRNGRYTPLRLLGTGTYGQVICCLDEVTGQNVAIKVAQEKPAYRSAALSEAQVLRSLSDCDEVVNIIDSFEQDGRICIVSELLADNLYEVMRKRQFFPLSVMEIACIAKRILTALSNLHHLGYMHCDVKPENIMVGTLAAPKAEHTISIPRTQYTSNARVYSNAMGNDSCHKTSRNVSILPCDNHHIERQHSSFSRLCSGSCDGSISSSKPYCYHSNENQSHTFSMQANDKVLSNDGASSGSHAAPRDRDTIDFNQTYLIDFGAVREFHKNTYYDVQSLWYRAPEVLCELPYTVGIDSWSVGCVLFELYSGKSLFQGRDPQDQLAQIVEHAGFPSSRALAACQAQQPHMSFPAVYGTYDKMKLHLRDMLQRSRTEAIRVQAFGKNSINNTAKHDNYVNKYGNCKGARYREMCGARCAKDNDMSLHAGFKKASGLRADGMSVSVCGEDAKSSAALQKKMEDYLIDLILALLHPDEELRLRCTDALGHPLFNTAGMPVCSDTLPSTSLWKESIKPCRTTNFNCAVAAEAAAQHALQPPAPAAFSQQRAQNLPLDSQYSVAQNTRNLSSLHEVPHSYVSGRLGSNPDLISRDDINNNCTSQDTNSINSFNQKDFIASDALNTWTHQPHLLHLQACRPALDTACQPPQLPILEQRPHSFYVNGYNFQQVYSDATKNDSAGCNPIASRAGSVLHTATSRNFIWNRTTRSETKTASDQWTHRLNMTNNVQGNQSHVTFESTAPSMASLASADDTLAVEASSMANDSMHAQQMYFRGSNGVYVHNGAHVSMSIASPVYVHAQTGMPKTVFAQEAALVLAPATAGVDNNYNYYVPLQQHVRIEREQQQKNTKVTWNAKDYSSFRSTGAVPCPMSSATNVDRDHLRLCDGHNYVMPTTYGEYSSISFPYQQYANHRGACNVYLPAADLGPSLNGLRYGFAHSCLYANESVCEA